MVRRTELIQRSNGKIILVEEKVLFNFGLETITMTTKISTCLLVTI